MASSSSSAAGKVIKRADPSTIHDKFMVGYQAWFTCPGDGAPLDPGHHGWLHWFNYPIPDGGRPNTDLWPDVSSYSQSETVLHSVTVPIGHRSNGAVKDRVTSPARPGDLTFLWLVTSLAVMTS